MSLQVGLRVLSCQLFDNHFLSKAVNRQVKDGYTARCVEGCQSHGLPTQTPQKHAFFSLLYPECTREVSNQEGRSPIFKDSGSKNHTIDGFGESLKIMATWTLWERSYKRFELLGELRTKNSLLDYRQGSSRAQDMSGDVVSFTSQIGPKPL